jgi:cytochrome c-type biogenesis protein CcsB
LLQLFLSITKNEKLKFLKLPTLLIAFIAHTIALGFWTSIAGRLPLSNTWEYFVSFVWGAVLLGILFEAKLKTGIFPPIVALLGAGGLIAAQSIPIARDITPMMPILRSNWLTYHVVTIMFGYGAMLVAFGIALWYLFLDYSGKGRKETLKQLDDHIYKIIQLGFLFLTIGIATGSIWAAYSWGRYWGWDPKEVWSAITWMIYGIYLHLRTDKRFLGRKSAIMAIIGFICILFTYFGVNYLLSGLHSYGK